VNWSASRSILIGCQRPNQLPTFNAKHDATVAAPAVDIEAQLLLLVRLSTMHLEAGANRIHVVFDSTGRDSGPRLVKRTPLIDNAGSGMLPEYLGAMPSAAPQFR